MTPMFLLGALAASVQAGPPPAQARVERELKSWVQARVGRDETSVVRFVPALVDLDGDRAPEALVYLSGRDWCGSGGCILYILQSGGQLAAGQFRDGHQPADTNADDEKPRLERYRTPRARRGRRPGP